jgi:hypothetical protein
MEETAKKIETEEISVVKVFIHNKWEIRDFINLLKSFEFLYTFYLSVWKGLEFYELDKDIQPTKKSKPSYLATSAYLTSGLYNLDYNPLIPFSLEQGLSGFFNKVNSLELIRIQYSSPGSIDFLGVGAIFKEIKEILKSYFPDAEKKKKLNF